MAYTLAQLEEIQGYFAQGITVAVLADGSRMEFRTLDEMKEIISTLKGELGVNPTHTNVAYPKHRRGFR